MARKRKTLTPEEASWWAEWDAGYDERTRKLRATIDRYRATVAAQREREERRQRRGILLRRLPL